MRRTISLAVFLFLLNVLLAYPLFLPGEFPYRDSIEGGYASMARFFAENPNPWGWNPTQYCGQPSQFTYLPLVHYATGALHLFLPFLPIEHVYRLITATASCLMPVSVFFFVLYFTRSRKWAFFAALTYTLLSPVYGLIYQADKDRGLVQLPWRIQVLVKYGEGPHTVAFAMLPVALIAIWRAATKPGFGPLLLAAGLMAAITLTNWVGAMTLAWCCTALLITSLIHRGETGFRPSRVIYAGAIAYGLAVFWLTPSFITVTALNWPKDAFNYQFNLRKFFLLLVLAGFLILLFGVCWFLRRRPYLCFVLFAVLGFGFMVINFYWYNQDLIPESHRYAIEFELFLILALFEVFRNVLGSRRGYLRYPAMALALFLYSTGVKQCFAFVMKDQNRWRPIPTERTQEFDLSQSLFSLKPAGRVYVSGGIRFRINQWFNLHQVGGTFETGLKNRVPVDLAYQIRTGIGSKPGQETRDALVQLEVLGAEYIVVSGPKSAEHYRDFAKPKQFEGLLEPVRRSGDDTIYRVPFASLAHLVHPEELPARPKVAGAYEVENPFTAAINDSARAKLQARWNGPARIEIAGPIPEGMLAAVSVNWDPGWEAEQNGVSVPLEANKWGFVVVHAKPSPDAAIALTYHPSWEQIGAAVLSLQVWLVCFVLLWKEKKSRNHIAG